MGAVVAPVSHNHLKRLADEGRAVTRVVVHRIESAYEILFFVKGYTDPMTVAKHRGGHRRWSKVDQALHFIESFLPHFPLENVDVFLRPASQPDSSPGQSH